MARILKHRGRFYDPNDSFESELVLTIRGPVVFEALMKDDITFTDAEWQALVTNHLDNDGRPEARLMYCLSRVPDFLRRGRNWRKDENSEPLLVQEVVVIYEMIQLGRYELKKRFLSVQKRLIDGDEQTTLLLEAQYVLCRVYALCLTIVIVLGCVLTAVNPFYAGLHAELHACAVEITSLAPLLETCRPLGASIMPIALGAAWVGTKDAKLHVSIETLIRDFLMDFSEGQHSDLFISSLESLERRWKLLPPKTKYVEAGLCNP